MKIKLGWQSWALAIALCFSLGFNWAHTGCFHDHPHIDHSK